MTTYRVTAPYVTLRARDAESGALVIRERYRDAIISGEEFDEESVERLLRKKMIEPVAEQAPEATGEPPANGGSGDQSGQSSGDQGDRSQGDQATGDPGAKPPAKTAAKKESTKAGT